MSLWNNKTIPFWQENLVFPNSFSILISEGKDYRTGWPESFKPTMTEIIKELSKSRTSYIRLDSKGDRIFISILSGKIIVSCTLNLEKNKVFLNSNNGLTFATNLRKTDFIKYGVRIEHNGVFIFSGREYNEKHSENDDLKLTNNIKELVVKTNNTKTRINKSNESQNEQEDEFTESESSKIEEILETLETYINKEYEIEDAKARAEKPFVYTEFKSENMATTYKYYYRITLLSEDIKRLQELNPTMLKIKKIDESFMDLEVFNIKPENSPNDIIVTTSFQTDVNMIDSSNELYLAAIPTLQKVRQKVIDDLRGKVSPNKWLIPLAAGVYSFDKTIKQSVPEYDETRALLKAQKDGVEKGAGSKDITLVLGPPGTGKTTVILSWVKFFVSKGMKVLITSQNNKAVDNVLERLAEEKDLECLRVGNESKVSSSIHRLLIENYALNAQSKLVESLSDITKSLYNGKNYLSTLNSASKELLQYTEKEIKFKNEISSYTKGINHQNDKLKINTSKINSLKIDNIFLEELIKSLTYANKINIIEARLVTQRNEMNLNKNNQTSLNEQLIKLEFKLISSKKELDKINEKINKYTNYSTLARIFMYLPHKKNLFKLNSLNNEIISLDKNILSTNKDIINFCKLEIELQKEIESIIYQLNEIKSEIPNFTQGLTVENSELKYEEFFQKQTIFTKIGFISGETIESKISCSQNVLLDNRKKIVDLNDTLNSDNEQLNILTIKLEELNQQYLNFIKSKPVFPEFTHCEYINDNLYRSFYPSEEMYNKLIIQTNMDLDFYNSLIEIVLIWEQSMNNERQTSLYETILEYVDVVGATCIGINSNKLFADIPFDVVIVDESGQIQLHNLMVPLSRASKAILVGDHKQLPPVVDDELALEIEEEGMNPIFLQKSWFEILWDPMPEDHKTMLDTQFRCPAIISDFVSKAFYESKYFAGSGMEKKQPILPHYNSTMTFIDTSNIPSSFEQSKITDGRTEVLGNKIETAIIINTLMSFIKELPYLATNNEIGIIVPYKNHVIEVKRTIKKLKLDIGNLNVEDLVASVDSYQGQERDVILFAFSRSNIGGNIGFLADWRRLNVAVTRTKKQLIMIGSLKTLTKDNQKKHEKEFKDAMRILEKDLREKNSIIDGQIILNTEVNK